ncbi:hypothetical protein DI272_18700 [Streptomyces sp. Act143]|nr:hypothetical protein DI272_18700 [Streptomyces sp. Act143]
MRQAYFGRGPSQWFIDDLLQADPSELVGEQQAARALLMSNPFLGPVAEGGTAAVGFWEAVTAADLLDALSTTELVTVLSVLPHMGFVWDELRRRAGVVTVRTIADNLGLGIVTVSKVVHGNLLRRDYAEVIAKFLLTGERPAEPMHPRRRFTQ